MEHNWTQVPHVGADDPATTSIPSVASVAPVAPAQPEPQTRLVGVGSPVRAIEAFEEVYRSSPEEFATIAGVADLTAETRRTLAALLMLSSVAREALVEALRLPDDVRDVIHRVLALPPEVRETLRVFLDA